MIAVKKRKKKLLYSNTYWFESTGASCLIEVIFPFTTWPADVRAALHLEIVVQLVTRIPFSFTVIDSADIVNYGILGIFNIRAGGNYVV